MAIKHKTLLAVPCLAALMIFAASVPHYSHADEAAAPASDCKTDDTRYGTDCAGDGGVIDEQPVIKTAKPEDSDEKEKPDTKTDTNLKDISPEDAEEALKKAAERVKAIEDAHMKLGEAFKELNGLPTEIEDQRRKITEALVKQGETGMADTLKKSLDQSGGAGGSPMDFLKNLIGNLGMTSQFRDPALNPNSPFGNMFNYKSDEGGVGYNPWADGNQPTAPVQNIPIDPNAELCIKALNGKVYQGKGQDIFNDPSFNAIFGGPSSKVDKNLIPILSAMYMDLKECHPGKNVCLESYGSIREQGRCGKQSNHCVNHNKHKHGDQVGKSTAIDVKGPDGVSYDEFRNVAYCATMNRGGGEVGDERDKDGGGYKHIHLGTSKQGPWSINNNRPGWWKGIDCNAKQCSDPNKSAAAPAK